jgi:hypothetical protein
MSALLPSALSFQAWFGGLRDNVLDRDRRRCRACGVAKRLIVHHRTGENAEQVLITLCVRCHVRLHRTRALRHWLPEPLLELWRELNPNALTQYQLPLRPATAAAKQRQLESPSKELTLRERPLQLLWSWNTSIDESISNHQHRCSSHFPA